jgi:fructose-bisphosphate aldolase, class II
MLTDPEEAATFVKATQLDALAIAIGTSHGAYKFSRKPTGDILAISRVKEIHARIPNTHLVMHGSSSVPQDLLAIINQYGGKMKETYGVPVEEIQEAIKHGVRKINIDTDIRLAMTGAVRKFMAENPDKFDAREWLKPAREAAKAMCKQRYLEFGCEGQASKIKGCCATTGASWTGRIAGAMPRAPRRSCPCCNPGCSKTLSNCGNSATTPCAACTRSPSTATTPMARSVPCCSKSSS